MKSFVIAVAAVTLIGHWAIYVHGQNSALRVSLNASYQSERLLKDQIVEYVNVLSQKSIKDESLKTQGYIAGVTDTINRTQVPVGERSEYFAIWHNGYDRGTDAQIQMTSLRQKLTPEPDPESSKPTLREDVPTAVKE